MTLDKSKSTDDWWVCECGNQPDTDGFFTADPSGLVVEPTPDDWDGSTWLCMSCEAIFEVK